MELNQQSFLFRRSPIHNVEAKKAPEKSHATAAKLFG